jgi:alpha-galactosidase
MARLVATALAAAALLCAAGAADNGEAMTPPMGWRSWNCFGLGVTQAAMESAMDALVSRARRVGGRPTSLADVGYVAAGLDDGWQACGAGAFGSFHDARGVPLVNTTAFPSLGAMVSKAHALGLRAGWYGNNCHCMELSCKYQAPPCWEGAKNLTLHMAGTVDAAVRYGFDGIKLDGCGEFRNLTWWYKLLNASGRPFVIENCHAPPFPSWPNDTTPGKGGDGLCSGTTSPSDCPYHFFRTSSDIAADFDTVYANLLSTRPFQGDVPLSRPGAWAYPDMMEVGMLATPLEDRTHFGAWCIVSSPLYLGTIRFLLYTVTFTRILLTV